MAAIQAGGNVTKHRGTFYWDGTGRKQQRRAVFAVISSWLGLVLGLVPHLSLAQEEGERVDQVVVTASRIRDTPGVAHTVTIVGQRIGSGTGARQKPPSGNTDKDKCQTDPSTGAPVLLSTGEKHLTEYDFGGVGRYGIGITRTYRSKSATGAFFGANWTSGFDPITAQMSTATCIPDNDSGGCYPPDVTVTFPEGAKYKYTFAGGGLYYVDGSSAMGVLVVVTVPNNRVASLQIDGRSYLFNTNSVPQKLTSVTSPEGVLVRYNYDNGGWLQSIVGLGGQTMGFTWTGGKVSQIQDQRGKT